MNFSHDYIMLFIVVQNKRCRQYIVKKNYLQNFTQHLIVTVIVTVLPSKCRDRLNETNEQLIMQCSQFTIDYKIKKVFSWNFLIP